MHPNIYIYICYILRSEVGLVAKKCYGNYQPPYGPQEKKWNNSFPIENDENAEYHHLS